MPGTRKSWRLSTQNIEPLRKNSGWIIVLGVLYVAAGTFALGSVLATIGSIFVIGIMMQIAGMAEVIHAFQVRRLGKFPLWLSIGVLYVITGFVMIQDPHLAARVLTLALGVALLASGIMRILLALVVGAGAPWIGALLAGMISVLIGAVIIARWPVSSLYILGVFLSIDLILTGAAWLAVGYGLREHHRPSYIGARFIRSIFKW